MTVDCQVTIQVIVQLDKSREVLTFCWKTGSTPIAIISLALGP